MQDQKTNWMEWIVGVTAFVLVTLLSHHFQPRITLHDGQGWDGAYYYSMAEQAAHGQPIHVASPYVYRVGLPVLAAMANPENLLSGFSRVNLVCNCLILVFFILWLRTFLPDWRIRCVLTLLLLTQWLGPFRFISFYPATTDNPQYAFLLLAFLGIYIARQREVLGTVIVTLTVLIGVFFRETVAVAGLAMIFLHNPIQFTGLGRNLAAFRFKEIVRRPKALHCLPFIAGLGGLVFIHLTIHKVDDGYSFVKTVFEWVYDKPWLTYVHGMFIVFGPAIALVIFNWRKSWSFLATHQPFLAFIGASLVLAYIGGNDTERYFYMMVPMIYILIGKAIADLWPVLQSKLLLLVLVLGQMASSRLFWIIPNYPNDYRTPLPVLSPLTNHCQYLDLFSFYGRRVVEAVSLAEYLLLTVVLIWWLSHRAQRLATRVD